MTLSNFFYKLLILLAVLDFALALNLSSRPSWSALQRLAMSIVEWAKPF